MSSSPIDIVKIYYGTLSLMGAEKAGNYLSPDFTLVGLTETPLDKATWVTFLRALKAALPDLKVRIEKIDAEDNAVRITEKGEGTHSGAMDFSVFGQPEIPASGLRVKLYPSEWLLTIVGNKITRAEFVSVPSQEAGLPGLVKALSVRPTPAE